MRKIILNVAVSLDGFIEGPKGEYDWCFTDQDYGMKEFLGRVDAILYGRKSYELMTGFNEGNPFGTIRGYVCSRTLKEVKGNYELIEGDAITRVREMKSAGGKDIWLFGGAVLTASLMNAGLVDEMALAVHPVILGAGKPLFTGVQQRVQLGLLNSKPYDSGLICLRYEISR